MHFPFLTFQPLMNATPPLARMGEAVLMVTMSTRVIVSWLKEPAVLLAWTATTVDVVKSSMELIANSHLQVGQ